MLLDAQVLIKILKMRITCALFFLRSSGSQRFSDTVFSANTDLTGERTHQDFIDIPLRANLQRQSVSIHNARVWRNHLQLDDFSFRKGRRRMLACSTYLGASKRIGGTLHQRGAPSYLAYAVTDFLADIMTLSQSVPQVMKLHMPLSRKIAVSAIFMLESLQVSRGQHYFSETLTLARLSVVAVGAVRIAEFVYAGRDLDRSLDIPCTFTGLHGFPSAEVLYRLLFTDRVLGCDKYFYRSRMRMLTNITPNFRKDVARDYHK